MPGDEWQKFANLRAYLSFMWTHPGKKLLFMGCEFGQPKEWNHDAELSWDLLQYESHRGIQGTLRALNRVYRSEPALWQRDFEPGGFSWAVADDREQSVLGYFRYGHAGARSLLILCNFTPLPRQNYRVGVHAGGWREIFNSDAAGFGGSDTGNAGVISSQPVAAHGQGDSIEVTLPPLATIILRHEH
jgi:1,4-alpha-glucan branching enzyme